MANGAIDKYVGGGLLARKRKVVKKAIVGNMAGSGGKGGLIQKSLAVLESWLDSGDVELQQEAVANVVKLLPYAIDKEATAEASGKGEAKTLNIQINSFSDFINDRLARTNLGEVIGGIITSQNAPSVVKPEDVEDVEEG